MNNYDSWCKWEGASEGSGRSEKEWLTNKLTGEIGLFKYPKSNNTTEHISERLAYTLALQLDIESAVVYIGTRNGRIGSMSMRINTDDESVVGGVNYINKIWEFFNPHTQYDPTTNTYYCLDHIVKSVKDIIPIASIIKMLLFDFIIGNSDRHQDNWSIVEKKNSTIKRFCPLYDNGSSLCCYVQDSDIIKGLVKDNRWLLAQIDSKSRSNIRINGKNKKIPTHKEMLEYLIENYLDEIKGVINKFLQKTSSSNFIDGLLEQFDENLLSFDKKELIKIFLLGKRDILIKAIDGK